MDKDKKIIAKNQWDEKFLRETPFMPFGSMMNAFGLINEGKGITTDDFLMQVEMIKDKAREITEELYEVSQRVSDDVEFNEKE
jgi:hypothetical protein